jgi:hypothetical protein
MFTNSRKTALVGIGVIAVLVGGFLVWINVRHRPVIYHDYTFALPLSKLPSCPSDNPVGPPQRESVPTAYTERGSTTVPCE